MTNSPKNTIARDSYLYLNEMKYWSNLIEHWQKIFSAIVTLIK